MDDLPSQDSKPIRIKNTAERLLNDHKDTFIEQIAVFRPRPLKVDTYTAGLAVHDTIVGARVRPLLADEIEEGQVSGIYIRHKSNVLDIHELRERPHRPPILNSSEFQVPRAYGPEQSSEEVYHDLVAPLIPWALGGGVSTLFAYGQTGSGKTYTVGDIQKLAAGDMMSATFLASREIYISAMELGRNVAFDLLNNRGPIKVLEDSFGEIQLVGIVENRVKTPKHLLELIEQSLLFRRSASTFRNDNSSRSHAIWRLRITNLDVPATPDGLFYLIDLAGSEFARDYQTHTDQQRQESRDINRSLSLLKDCIRGRALQDKYIPYRQSVLTKVLKHVFDPNSGRACKTAVLACLNPSALDVIPSKNTLRFAELLKVPVTKAKEMEYHAEIPATWSNAQLREWIDANSGIPPVSSALLAPTESGTQLIRLPKGLFVTRCLETPGITIETAGAFYDRLWMLHHDSRKVKTSTITNKPLASKVTAKAKLLERNKAVGFKDRLAPGMFVKVWAKWRGGVEETVMLMCPEHAFEAGEQRDEGELRRYTCAGVVKGEAGWMVNVGDMKIVALREMEEEVSLVFDAASRYYFMEL